MKTFKSVNDLLLHSKTCLSCKSPRHVEIGNDSYLLNVKHKFNSKSLYFSFKKRINHDYYDDDNFSSKFIRFKLKLSIKEQTYSMKSNKFDISNINDIYTFIFVSTCINCNNHYSESTLSFNVNKEGILSEIDMQYKLEEVRYIASDYKLKVICNYITNTFIYGDMTSNPFGLLPNDKLSTTKLGDFDLSNEMVMVNKIKMLKTFG